MKLNKKWRVFLVAALALGLMGTVSAQLQGVIDDFEDGDMSEYSIISTKQGTRYETTTDAYEGTYSGVVDGHNLKIERSVSGTPVNITARIKIQQGASYESARLIFFNSNGEPLFNTFPYPYQGTWQMCGQSAGGNPGFNEWLSVEFRGIDYQAGTIEKVNFGNGDYVRNNVEFCNGNTGSLDSMQLHSRGTGIHEVYFDAIFRTKRNSPPQFDSVSTSPSSWTLGSAVNVSATVSDSDGTVSSVEADVWENGTKIVNDASLSDSDGDGTWEINNLFTVDQSNVYYNVSITATDNDGVSSTKEVSQFVSDLSPSFSVFMPESKIYGKDFLSWDLRDVGSTDDVPGESFDIRIYEDGQQVDSASVSGGNVSGSWTSSDGNHTFKAVVSESDGDSTLKTVDFIVDLIQPDINISHPVNRTDVLQGISLNYTVSDENLDTSSCKYSKDGGTNFSISNCQNTSIDFGSIGNHTVTVWASDTVNNTGRDSTTFFADSLNRITASVASSGSSINDFEVVISNSTTSLGGSVSDGVFEFYTSEMPTGDVTVTVQSDGFQTESKKFSNVGTGFSQDLSFSLERAGFSASIWSEKSNTRLSKPVKLTVRNSTSSESWYWGTVFSQGEMSDSYKAFDSDKGSRAVLSAPGSDGGITRSVTGAVSLGTSSSENVYVKFGGENIERDSRGELTSVEMYKNGAWTTVWKGTSVSYGTKNITVDNSGGGFTGLIRVTGRAETDINDGQYADFYLYEVWANSFSGPSLQYPNYPTGEVTITADDNYNNEFRPRKYYASLDENSRVNLRAYLLGIGDGLTTSVKTVDSSRDALQGSTVTIQRFLGGSYRTVAQDRTSSDGVASFYLSPDTSYRVVASHPGFESFTGSFSPANYQYNPLVVQLGKKNNFTESTTWSSVEYKLLPDQGRLNASATYTFNWSVIDSQNGISGFGLRLKNSSGALLDSKSVTGSPSGGSVSLQFNISNSSVDSGEELSVEGFFVKDETQFKYQRTYNVLEKVTPGLFSISSIMDDFESSTSDMAQGIVALIFTLAIGSGLKSRFNKIGTGVVCMLVLGVFTLQGWFSPFFWMLTALALIGLLGRRG